MSSHVQSNRSMVLVRRFLFLLLMSVLSREVLPLRQTVIQLFRRMLIHSGSRMWMSNLVSGYLNVINS